MEKSVPQRDPDADYTYEFTGWSASTDDAGNVYYSPTYDQLAKPRVNVVWIEDAETPLANAFYGADVAYDADYSSIPVPGHPVRAHHDFIGWGEPVLVGDYVIFTARWKARTYAVNWIDQGAMPDGGDRLVDSIVLNEGEEYGTHEPQSPANREGYKFAGWSAPAYDENGNAYLYAIWKEFVSSEPVPIPDPEPNPDTPAIDVPDSGGEGDEPAGGTSVVPGYETEHPNGSGDDGGDEPGTSGLPVLPNDDRDVYVADSTQVEQFITDFPNVSTERTATLYEVAGTDDDEGTVSGSILGNGTEEVIEDDGIPQGRFSGAEPGIADHSWAVSGRRNVARGGDRRASADYSQQEKERRRVGVGGQRNRSSFALR